MKTAEEWLKEKRITSNVQIPNNYMNDDNEWFGIYELLTEFAEQVAREQREHDLNEIEDERGNQELATVIKAIKWNIRNSPLVTQNNKE